MGEHSIITPETRVIDRESGSRVVCQLAREFTAGGLARSAGGVRRTFEHEANSSKSISIISSSSSSIEKVVIGGGRVIQYDCRKKSVERDTSETKFGSRRVVETLSSSGFLRQFVFLILSFVGLAAARRASSKTAVSTSRRGPQLVSSSWRCALVSLLLVVGLLRPSFAVPTSGASLSVGNSRSDATLTRIMPLQLRGEHANPMKEETTNFENVVVEPTMNRRRLAATLEDPTNQHYYHDDDDDDDDVDDDEFMLPSLLQHPRESGLESRSRLREAELDTIRRSIVEGLGLERIPDPSKANVSQTEYRRAHEEYLNRLQSRAGQKDGRLRRLHTFHPADGTPVTLVNRTRRSVYSSDENRLEPASLESRVGLFFPLEIPEDDTLVDHATLRLLVDPSGTSSEGHSHDISLYRITADSRQFVSRQRVQLKRRGPRWVELEATELASLWHEYGVENLGVELRFERSDNGRISEEPRISEPALNVFTTRLSMEESEAHSSRRKRRASPEHLMSLHKGRRTECRGDSKKCCRHEMTVIFKDLKGFEFIVQPKNFDAGYCKGRCPPRYNPAHHHALLQSLIWKEDKRKAPRPCCAPSKLDELEILYFDENDPTKLKVSSWKNMKVLECACS